MLVIGGREDVQFLSHLPKYTIAYDQHSGRDILYGERLMSNCDTLNHVLTRTCY